MLPRARSLRRAGGRRDVVAVVGSSFPSRRLRPISMRCSFFFSPIDVVCATSSNGRRTAVLYRDCLRLTALASTWLSLIGPGQSYPPGGLPAKASCRVLPSVEGQASRMRGRARFARSAASRGRCRHGRVSAAVDPGSALDGCKLGQPAASPSRRCPGCHRLPPTDVPL
jgi:hypothetical protein